MCEETGREGRGLENKWIYVLLLFVIPGGQWYNFNAQWAFFISDKIDQAYCCSAGQ